jgi:hypothetical protein
MKRLMTFAAILVSGCFSSNVFAQNDAKQVSNVESPYKVGATNISIGNPVYAQKVLWAWKFYDDNTLNKIDDLIADDIVATLADGMVIKGKDNFLKGIKDYRNSLTSAVSTIDACTTLKTPDNPDHEVVSVWGTETATAKDGKVTKTHLNEVWFFNKNGKVDEFHQMAAKDVPDKK